MSDSLVQLDETVWIRPSEVICLQDWPRDGESHCTVTFRKGKTWDSISVQSSAKQVAEKLASEEIAI